MIECNFWRESPPQSTNTGIGQQRAQKTL